MIRRISAWDTTCCCFQLIGSSYVHVLNEPKFSTDGSGEIEHPNQFPIVDTSQNHHIQFELLKARLSGCIDSIKGLVKSLTTRQSLERFLR